MNWVVKFLTSSLGKKLIMSLTGLFLCTFLVVHMIGNLALFADADGHSFNEYAEFMAHNPLIKTVSLGLYFFIFLHAVQGIAIWVSNRNSAGGSSRYKGSEKAKTEASAASRNMMWLGVLILAFLLLHMAQFWLKAKFTGLTREGDLYYEVSLAFQQEWVVIVYLLGLFALSAHLLHGFQSAFQTLGLNHKKYTPVIKAVGVAFAILVPLGFATMPIFFYIKEML
ncbi:succinate dehydrogenase cytochrome b subunit [Saprospira sp. CCB-QB6]|uniref:succinate dehydrogenase cytochrome b subunit n=1 Tax=Saprospira sp. CCB-QB6 TaxID=3023936 RepID=UPI00234A3D38|nr:succinate dehydrogenase cytochrome b subunit [Saprospira sp. CCB-QB6]WCL80027.1 succinate dehydrogenase cytochrome b subunit [Saprospira sp. CCB-QB6]